jgi:NADH-ubiquinone oxidoreductase chain 2
MKAEEVIETRNHMFNLFLAVFPVIFLINAIFILLIHGVVFSTSKKDDYPPLVSNVGWLGLLILSLCSLLMLSPTRCKYLDPSFLFPIWYYRAVCFFLWKKGCPKSLLVLFSLLFRGGSDFTCWMNSPAGSDVSNWRQYLNLSEGSANATPEASTSQNHGIDQEEVFAAPPAPVQPAGQEDLRGGAPAEIVEPTSVHPPLPLSEQIQIQLKDYLSRPELGVNAPKKSFLNRTLNTRLNMSEMTDPEKHFLLALIKEHQRDLETSKSELPELNKRSAGNHLVEEFQRWKRQRHHE